MGTDLSPLISKKDWYSVSKELFLIVEEPSTYSQIPSVPYESMKAIVEQIEDCAYALDKVTLVQFYSIYAKMLPVDDALQFIQDHRAIFSNYPEALSIIIALQYLLYTSVLDPLTLEHQLDFSYEQQLLESLSSEAFVVSSYAEMMALEAAIRYAIVEQRYYNIYLFYNRMVQIAIVTAWSYSILSKYFPIAVYSALYVQDYFVDLISLVYQGPGRRSTEHPCVCDGQDETAGAPCGSPYCITRDLLFSEIFPFRQTPVHVLLLKIVEGEEPSDEDLPVIAEFNLDFRKVRTGIHNQVLQHRFCTLLYNAPLVKRNGYPYAELMEELKIPSVLELERFIITAMRANLFTGRLNTLSQTLIVTIIQTRTVSSHQVKAFGKRLREWADKVAHCRSLMEQQL